MHLPSSLTAANIVVLTGAGASVPLGLCTTTQFLQRFRSEQLVALQQQRSSSQQLVQIAGFIDQLPSAARDIEQVLREFDQIIQARDLIKSQRVFSSWSDSLMPPGDLQALDEVRNRIYDTVVDHYSEEPPDLAAELYRPLFEQFSAWFREIPNLGTTLPVFTLNYDTAVETAAGHLNVDLVDGIDRSLRRPRWRKELFEEYAEVPDRTSVVLMKLHGSVTWCEDTQRPGNIVEMPIGSGRNPGRYSHALIYPSLAPKNLGAEPFHTNYEILRKCLRGARALLVIGCSLRDSELNVVIADAMDDNTALNVVTVSPSANHKQVAEALGVDAMRVGAYQAEFRVVEGSDQGSNSFMGGLCPML